MGLGNGNSTKGDKGSNYSYELKSLRGLDLTVTTLQDILTHLQDAKEDAEILLVRDEGNNDLIVQQIRIYDTITDTWSTTYAELDGTAYTPTGPLVYLDSSSTLNQVIGQDAVAHPTPNQQGFRILGTDGTTDYQLKVDASGNLQIDVVSSVLPTGAATEVTLALLEAKLNTLGQKASADSAPVVLSTEQEAIIDAIKTAVEGTIAVSATTLPLPTGAATSALQTALNALITTIDAVLDNILLDTTAIKTATEAINTKLTAVVRTSSLTNVVGAATASVAAGARSVSFFNDGPNDVTVAGGTLESGISVTFSAGGEEDTLAAIPYITIGGSKLVITTVV